MGKGFVTELLQKIALGLAECGSFVGTSGQLVVEALHEDDYLPRDDCLSDSLLPRKSSTSHFQADLTCHRSGHANSGFFCPVGESKCRESFGREAAL